MDRQRERAHREGTERESQMEENKNTEVRVTIDEDPESGVTNHKEVSPPAVDSPVSNKKVHISRQLKELLAEPPRIELIKPSSAGLSCCIHRVPQSIRQDASNFVPQIISIGPFHYDKRGYNQQRGAHHQDKKLEEDKKAVSEQMKDYQQSLEEKKYIQEMEQHKRRYLRLFSRRGEDCLYKFAEFVEGQLPKARECYSEEIKLDDAQLVQMMVLDSCFIIVLFLKTYKRMPSQELKSELEKSELEKSELEQALDEELGKSKLVQALDEEDKDDPLIKVEWLRKQLAIELLMLENQIPFFIPQELFRLMGIPSTFTLQIALRFFRFALPNSVDGAEIRGSVTPLHLLHLVHSSLLPNCERPSESNVVKMIPCSSDLQKLGFKFKEKVSEFVNQNKDKEEPKKSMLDIDFESIRSWYWPFYSGVIKIPPMKVSVIKGVLLLNLVAFEQCYRYCGTAFSAYIVFMDCLISNDEDVGILCNHGIENFVGSNQHLVDLINKVGGRLTVDDGYFFQKFKDINDRYEEVRNQRIRASIKRNYAKNPTAVISILIAIVSVIIAITFQLINLIRNFTK